MATVKSESIYICQTNLQTGVNWCQILPEYIYQISIFYLNEILINFHWPCPAKRLQVAYLTDNKTWLPPCIKLKHVILSPCSIYRSSDVRDKLKWRLDLNSSRNYVSNKYKHCGSMSIISSCLHHTKLWLPKVPFTSIHCSCSVRDKLKWRMD